MISTNFRPSSFSELCTEKYKINPVRGQSDVNIPRETSLKRVLTTVGDFDNATEKIFPRIIHPARILTIFKCLSSSLRTETSDKLERNHPCEKLYGLHKNLQPNSVRNVKTCDSEAESLFLVEKCITESKHFCIFGTIN